MLKKIELRMHKLKVPTCLRVSEKDNVVWGGCIVGTLVDTGEVVRTSGKVVSITPTRRQDVVLVLTDDDKEWIVHWESEEQKRAEILKRLMNTESIDIYLTVTTPRS